MEGKAKFAKVATAVDLEDDEGHIILKLYCSQVGWRCADEPRVRTCPVWALATFCGG